MMCETLVGKIVQQKLLAEAKYPDFAVRFLRERDDPDCLAAIQCRLARARYYSDREASTGYSVEATLTEEVYEVLEAAAAERWETCMMELAQVGSVVLRAMEWIQQNKLNRPVGQRIK